MLYDYKVDNIEKILKDIGNNKEFVISLCYTNEANEVIKENMERISCVLEKDNVISFTREVYYGNNKKHSMHIEAFLDWLLYEIMADGRKIFIEK